MTLEKKIYPMKPNQETVEAQSLRKKFPIMPLEYMLSVLNDVRQPNARRDEMAKVLAPYLHQRIVAVEIPKTRPPPMSMDLRALSDEEFEQLNQLISKARWVPFQEDHR